MVGFGVWLQIAYIPIIVTDFNAHLSFWGGYFLLGKQAATSRPVQAPANWGWRYKTA